MRGTTIPRHGCRHSGRAIHAELAEVSRLLLDSTVIIDALGGAPNAQRVAGLRRVGIEPWACAISVEEIWRGIRSSEETSVRRFFNGMRIAPLGVAEGIRAGNWRRTYAAKGVTLFQADCLVASAAVSIGAPLATANVKDFPMDELVVERWASGAG